MTPFYHPTPCVTIIEAHYGPCLVKRTKLFRQPSGSDEGADAITLQGSQKRLRAGYDPIASGLLRIAVRSRPFLTEHADDNRFCYYKGGLEPKA